jgi:hypothetical protein
MLRLLYSPKCVEEEFCEVRIDGVQASCIRFLRRVGYVARVAWGAGFFVSRRPKEVDERNRTYGGGTGEVLQQLWAGVTSGRPFLLELR